MSHTRSVRGAGHRFMQRCRGVQVDVVLGALAVTFLGQSLGCHHERVAPAEPQWIGQAATVPGGLIDTGVATGLTSPTALALLPDGRVFVTEQTGKVKVIANDVAAEHELHRPVRGDAGRSGARDARASPSIPTSPPTVRLSLLHGEDAHRAQPHRPLYRQRQRRGSQHPEDRGGARGHRDLPGHRGGGHLAPRRGAALRRRRQAVRGGGRSPAQRLCPEPEHHQGQDPAPHHQRRRHLQHPLGQPLPQPNHRPSPVNLPDGPPQSVHLRHPPGTSDLFISDVGNNAWEEVNVALASDASNRWNFGWPTTEGDFSNGTHANFKRPAHAYPHGTATGQGCSIVGAGFYPSTAPGLRNTTASSSSWTSAEPARTAKGRRAGSCAPWTPARTR